MADYDLTGSLKKDFTFSIEGEEFTFRKPTVREMRTLVKRFSAVDKQTDTDDKARRSQEAMDELYTYIDSESGAFIGEVMDNQTVDVQAAFMDMVLEQLTKSKK